MTVKLIHHSPLGGLEIPTVLGIIEPGEPFEVDDDIADSLLEQHELYSLAPTPERTVSELREIAAGLGIDTKGLLKQDLIDAIATATPGADSGIEDAAAPDESVAADIDGVAAATAAQTTTSEAAPAIENPETQA